MLTDRKKLFSQKKIIDIPEKQIDSLLPYEIALALNNFIEKVLNGRQPVNILVYHMARQISQLTQMSEDGTLDIDSLEKLSKGLNKQLLSLNKTVIQNKNLVSPLL